MKKKSFIVHIDSLDVLKHLTKEQAGELLFAWWYYHTDQDVNLTGLMNAVFTPFKNQFERDEESYQNIVDRNKSNIGKRWNKNDTKNTTGKTGIPNDTKNTDSDNKNDNDSKSDSENELSRLPMFAEIESLPFLEMCREVSKNGGKLSQVSLYKKEYYQLIANNKDLQKQTGRSEAWLVNAATKFIKDHAAVNQEWANYADFFKHFLNWTRKQPV